MTLKQHLLSRHVDLNVHRVWFDDDEYVATFPLSNLSGMMVGYQQYRPLADKTLKNSPREGRYFTFTKKETRGFWGVESWNFSNTLFLTEGVFDAARLTERGVSAVATLSNDPVHLKNFFYMLNRPVVAVCDAGNAGRKLAKYGTTSVTVPEEMGDLGDATNEYVDHLLSVYNR